LEKWSHKTIQHALDRFSPAAGQSFREAMSPDFKPAGKQLVRDFA
jgi:hypothetical protein